MNIKKYISILISKIVLAGVIYGDDPANYNSQEEYNSSSAYSESWDPNQKAFVWKDGTVLYKRKNASDSNKKPEDILAVNWTVVNSDNRNFRFENTAVAPLTVVPAETPGGFLTRLDAAAPDAVKNLNPKGEAIRDLIRNVLYQSWEYMTDELNQDVVTVDDAKKDNRKDLLQKIWEYRQWHHDFILRKTQTDLNTTASYAGVYDSGEARLTEWAAAGSTTLTSDIDVNLKGTNTEAAAKKFNELFKADGWNYEPGVVYDVNVYALDFLHKEATFGSGMVIESTDATGIKTTTDLHGNILKRKDTNTDETLENNTAFGTGFAGKEGARLGLVRGGYGDPLDQVLFDTDTANQEIWPHVKARLYMTSAEFDSYAAAININTRVWDGSTTGQTIKTIAENRYNTFRATLTDKMFELSLFNGAKPALPAAGTGIQQLNEYARILLGQGIPQTDVEKARAADLLMASSNRIYESKLGTIYGDRNQLKAAITEYDELESQRLLSVVGEPLSPQELQSLLTQITNKKQEIETKLVILRNLVSEATLFANEAYVTDGSVNHVVVGVQEGVPITVTNNESVNSVIENMADSLKEIGRHGGPDLTAADHLGEAAFKAGKYMFRLADAAINMGYSDRDIFWLYQAGDEISNEIKKNEPDPEQQYAQSAGVIQRILGVNTPATLKTKVRTIAIAVIVWAQGQPAGFGSQLSAKVGNAQKCFQEIYNATSGMNESWDPNEKAFVWKDGTILYKRTNASDSDKIPEHIPAGDRTVVTSDNRNFKFENTAVAALPVVAAETPADFLTRLDAAAADAVKNLNPKGKAIRDLIQNVLYQSWEYMTHVLNTGADTGNRKNLLRKIWEYRQWHHDFLLYETQSALGQTQVAGLYDSGQARLTEWAAAGSTTLTSDIDVNLKGTDTEAAAKTFNDLFSADGWKYEPGVVYDVNVYALDFLHKEATFGSGMVIEDTDAEGVKTTTDLHGNILKRKDTNTGKTLENNTAFGTGFAGKEGARRGLIRGGFADLSNAADTANQDIWPHVKARLYMTSAEFDAYWTAIGITTPTKQTVLDRYEDFRDALTDQMVELSGFSGVKPGLTGTGTGIQRLNAYAKVLLNKGSKSDAEFDADAADLLMASSNRIYEEKLETIHTNRNELKGLVTTYDGAQTALLNTQIEDKLVSLRNLVSEATLFANEAYVTDGSVNHVVVGVQEGVPITVTNNESVNSVIENMADALKEIVRHGGDGNLGEAAFKAGKYMFRLADAAINMSNSDRDIAKLYVLGDEISNTIKNTVSDPVDQLDQSAVQIVTYFPDVESPDELKTKVREIASAVIVWDRLQAAGFGSQLTARVGTARNSQQEIYNSTSTYKESWDPNEKAFVWKEGVILYKRKNTSDSDKIPEHIPTGDWTVVTSDNRNFKFENTAVAPLPVVPGETPTEFLTRLDAAAPNAVKNLNPKGKPIRDLMQNVLYQSWEYMTDELNTDAVTIDDAKKDNRKNLLQKIWEYRQWHHDSILRKTQTALNATPSAAGRYDSNFARLTEWSAAGSTTLTSDIDVNLKGTNTEAAAKTFNELFKANGWKYEPGIVYDVNVYALDFLHKEATFGSGMVDKTDPLVIKDLHGNILKRKDAAGETIENNTAFGTGFAGKEGARKGRIQGGFVAPNGDDIANQDVWTHVKARLYMTAAEFDAYSAAIGIHQTVWSGDTALYKVSTLLNPKIKEEALARYNAFRNALTAKMLDILGLQSFNEQPDASLTGIEQLNAYAENALKAARDPDPAGHVLEAAAADLLMAASNRIYEAKLEEIYAERNNLKEEITSYDAAQTNALNDSIEVELEDLRNLISEATLFANEAYVTDGSVNHVVVGVQEGVPITVTNNESSNSVIENMADALKEMTRHGGPDLTATDHLGEAAFKAGKYMFRLADAAINMGYPPADISALYSVGYEISNNIKNTITDPIEQENQSAIQIRIYFPDVTTPAQLKEKIRALAIAVIVWKQSNDRPAGFGSQLSAKVGDAKTIIFLAQEPLTESTIGNPYAFQGRRLDPETGLYYYRYRYYDPNLGEFVTIDPLGVWNHGQGNGFSAFGEDPWNNGDPFGLDGKLGGGLKSAY